MRHSVMPIADCMDRFLIITAHVAGFRKKVHDALKALQRCEDKIAAQASPSSGSAAPSLVAHLTAADMKNLRARIDLPAASFTAPGEPMKFVNVGAPCCLFGCRCDELEL